MSLIAAGKGAVHFKQECRNEATKKNDGKKVVFIAPFDYKRQNNTWSQTGNKDRPETNERCFILIFGVKETPDAQPLKNQFKYKRRLYFL